MRLLTYTQYAQLLQNGRRQVAAVRADRELDFAPVAKLTHPRGGTWLLTQVYGSEPNVAWGLCDPGPHWGSVDLTELEKYGDLKADPAFQPTKSALTYWREAQRRGKLIA